MKFSQNLKALVFGKYVLLQVILCFLSLSLWAQDKPLREKPVQDLPAQPTQEGEPAAAPAADTTRINLPPPAQGDITTTINYDARDSILLDAVNKIVYLYGEATIVYGDIELEAAQITIDWQNNTLTAVGVKDSLGKDVGRPVFKQGSETYVTDNISYNFKNRKAVIRGVVTQQQEAFIHGDLVKKDAENRLYIKGARYTTCNLEHPHFYIHAEKLKMMPNDKIVSGPFHLKIADVSTPLGFLFGMFPVPRERVSGVIIPTYGEENRRGFFLREGGYYIAFNEYIDLALTGEIYTKGSRGFQIASNYRKRYRYGGNFSLRYNKQAAEEEGNDNFSRDFWVNWSHNPESRGNSRFSASVSAGTRSFTQNNPSTVDLAQNVNQQFSSSINYNNTLPGTPFTFGARASMVQDIANNTTTATLPELSLAMQRQYPARWFNRTGRSWWEQINFNYTGVATNQISNRPETFGIAGVQVANVDQSDTPLALSLDNLPVLFTNADNGIKHTIPVSTTFNVLKHFSLTPQFSYQELWYFRRLEYENFDAERGGVTINTNRGFNRAGTWSFSTGLNTKLYGFAYFDKNNPLPKIKAIRHMMIPSITLGYAPDFSREKFGNFQNDVLVGYDQEKNPVYRDLSYYQGFAYGAPGSGEQGRIGFSLNNSVEMKVREKGDTATAYKKVPILERLNFATSYNMLAEEFKLDNINISGATSLFNNLIAISFGGSINPYMYQIDSVYTNRIGEEVIVQSRLDKLAITNTDNRSLGQLQQAQIGFTTNLSSAGLKGEPTNAGPPTGGNVSTYGEQVLEEGSPIGNELGQQGLVYRYTDPTEYVDFTLPWSLRFNYTLGYTKLGFLKSVITQGVNFSGDLKITDNWKLGYASSYDFVNSEFTNTRLTIYRDLHCWQMNVNWVPFGRFQSFSVEIRVKSPILQDLKLSRRRSFFDY